MPESVRSALSLLAEYGWVKQVELGSGTGRPSEVWVTNPEVKPDGK